MALWKFGDKLVRGKPVYCKYWETCKDKYPEEIKCNKAGVCVSEKTPEQTKG